MPKQSQPHQPQLTKLFNNKKLRATWDKNENAFWVSVVDVIAAIRNVDYDAARNYWKQLKHRIVNNPKRKAKYFKSHQLKLACKDGSLRHTDVMLYSQIIQLIQLLPASTISAVGGLNGFKKYIGKVAANSKELASLINNACEQQQFFKMPYLQTTVHELLF